MKARATVWLISIPMAIPIPIPRMMGMRVVAGYATHRGRDPPAVGRPSIIQYKRGGGWMHGIIEKLWRSGKNAEAPDEVDETRKGKFGLGNCLQVPHGRATMGRAELMADPDFSPGFEAKPSRGRRGITAGSW